MNKTDYICLSAIFLIGLFFWTLPYQENHMPYGETDAAAHYSLADNWATNGFTQQLPFYLDFRYGLSNSFHPGYIWYPIEYHLILSFAEKVTNKRVIGIFFMNTILCLLVPISIFFFLRKLFGLPSAIIASTIYLFSMRDITTYLWGQWPTLISYGMVLFVIYLFYTKRLYIMGCVLALQFLIHPIGAIISVAIMSVYTVLLILKNKSFFVVEYKKLFFSVLIFFTLIIALAPTQTLSVIMFASGNGEKYYNDAPDFSVMNFFTWYRPMVADGGYPPTYFSFSYNHPGSWLIITCVLITIAYCLIRRKDKDLLLLSMVIALYILLHTYAFGLSTAYDYRLFSLETFILYTLAGASMYYITKTEFLRNKNVHYILAVVFLIVICFNAYSAYTYLHEAYGGTARITQSQYDASLWMKANLPYDSIIYDPGEYNIAKLTWKRAIAQRLHHNAINITHNREGKVYHATHILIDRNQLAMMGGLDYANQIESKLSSQKIYDKDGIKIYRLH